MTVLVVATVTVYDDKTPSTMTQAWTGGGTAPATESQSDKLQNALSSAADGIRVLAAKRSIDNKRLPGG